MKENKHIEISKRFYIEPAYVDEFKRLNLSSIEQVFSFTKGKDLAKENLADFRSRLQLVAQPENVQQPVTLFLKRYIKPPALAQVKNWYYRKGHISLGKAEVQTAETLREAGINTPKTVAFGEKWVRIFERGSFTITEKIPDAEALERQLPEYCTKLADKENIRLKRDFINRLAQFVKKFHETGFRHRDLYFSHMFYDNGGNFHLIDLSRTFRPTILSERFRRKDLAQLFYSAPGKNFTRTDRLRFYLAYCGRTKLTKKDKTLIRTIIKKVKKMARHDRKQGRTVPFEN